MELTKQGAYVLRARIDLGIAREAGRPVIHISESAECERNPMLEVTLRKIRQDEVAGPFSTPPRLRKQKSSKPL